MKKIALTGGIGCGKSTVSNIFFEKFRIPTIDTDILSRRAVAKGTEGLEKIINHFGSSILNDEGGLDRLKLKKLVFFDKKQKKILENIVHPLVHRLLKEEVNITRSAYCLIAVPILRKDSEILSIVDRIIFIDCKESIQIKRTLLRDNLDLDLIKNIIKSQPSRFELSQIANDIIQNNGGLNRLTRDIQNLHKKYIELT